MEFVVALVGLLGAAVGAAGGYFSARHQGRAALEVAKAQAKADLEIAMANTRAEQQRHLAELAVQLAKAEVERNPDSPYLVGEHAGVLMSLLPRLVQGTLERDDADVTVFRETLRIQCEPWAHPVSAELPDQILARLPDVGGDRRLNEFQRQLCERCGRLIPTDALSCPTCGPALDASPDP